MLIKISGDMTIMDAFNMFVLLQNVLYMLNFSISEFERRWCL